MECNPVFVISYDALRSSSVWVLVVVCVSLRVWFCTVDCDRVLFEIMEEDITDIAQYSSTPFSSS